MNALLDKDFVVGFLVGVGIGVAVKLLKDLVLWIRDRKGKGNLSSAMCKAALRRMAAIFTFFRLADAKRKGSAEIYEIPSSAPSR